jgi:hypothetical protein
MTPAIFLLLGQMQVFYHLPSERPCVSAKVHSLTSARANCKIDLKAASTWGGINFGSVENGDFCGTAAKCDKKAILPKVSRTDP